MGLIKEDQDLDSINRHAQNILNILNMSLIKLSAIDSTNDYLKVLSRNQIIENFTTVVAEKQTQGKGQMGATWISEEGKNLIMSILVKDYLIHTNAIFNLNIAFSLAVITALKKKNIPDLSIKWPNDILSGGKKISGILIENSIKSNKIYSTIIGTGINISQEGRIKLTRLLAKLGHNTPIEYPDITTKAKAQEFIGLPLEKLKAEKKEFKEKVLPEWDKKAAERQATY